MRETASTILIETMQQFSHSEPELFLALWTNEAGDIVVRSNTGVIETLGLVEYAKAWLLEEKVYSDE